jgi:hypothetical protein
MSLFQATNITCPNCETVNEIDAVDSVNADRRPDLRQAILEGEFQIFPCVSCDEDIRLEPQFNYLNIERSLWLAAYPGGRMSGYLDVEDNVMDVYDLSYGARAQKAARSIGDDLDVRLTFGWPAVREKLLLREEGISDVEIESLKIDLLRRLPEAPLAPGVELRVTQVQEDQLTFTWLETVSEAVIQEFAASRQLLDEVSANAAGWAAIQQELQNGPFVDMQKLYMGQGREAAE